MNINGRLTALENRVTATGTRPPAYLAAADWADLERKLKDAPRGRCKVYIGVSPDDWPGNEDDHAEKP